MDEKPIIALEDISFSYPGGNPILRDLDLAIFENERIGLVAPNGSGKTTLFYIIMGLLKPSVGHITAFGKTVRSEKDFYELRRRVGLLFQDSDDQLFSPTVIEDVAFGPLNLGKEKEEALAVSRRILSFLGMKGFENRITIKLSGGEKRLVAMATILAMEPRMLLLDEPCAGLDEATKERLTGILTTLGIGYIAVSHDYDFLAAATDKIYTLREGKIQTDADLQLHRHLHAHRFGSQRHTHI